MGDAIEVTHKITRKPTRLTLVGPDSTSSTSRQPDHMYGKTYRQFGVIGSSVIQCFEMNITSTGMNEKDLKAAVLPIKQRTLFQKIKLV